MSYFSDSRISSVMIEKKTFIFDLNGLMIDDEAIQLSATNMAFSSDGLFIDEETWRNNCVGRKPLEYMPHLLLSVAGRQARESDIVEKIAYKDKIYADMIARAGSSILRNGLIDFLSYLQNGDNNIGICTSTTRSGLHSILGNKNLPIRDYVNTYTCGDEVSRSKPNPDIYHEACRKAKTLAEASVAFEDSRIGLLAAKSAGLVCIVCPNVFTIGQNFAEADLIISDFSTAANVITGNS